MARGPEARVQDRTIGIYRRHGWVCTKVSNGGGWTDFICISPEGFVLLPEFKRPGKTKLDPLQMGFHKLVSAAIRKGERQAHIEITLFNDVHDAWLWLRDYNKRYGRDTSSI